LRTAFSQGNALYAFDLSPDLAEENHFNLQKQGSVRLVLKFRQALNDNVSVIAYAEFENVLETTATVTLSTTFQYEYCGT